MARTDTTDTAFAELLAAAMKQLGITSQIQMAKALDVSQPAVGRWLKGHAPTDNMRDHVMRMLATLERDGLPEGFVKGKLAEAQTPVITAKLEGGGLKLEMQVTRATARQLLHVLLGDNEE